jgi:hypothetical protein
MSWIEQAESSSIIKFFELHVKGIGLVSSILTIGAAAFTIWKFGRSTLVWMFRWLRSFWHEARPEVRRLQHPILVQRGDRRSTYWGSQPHGKTEMIFFVKVDLHITNLEDMEIHISETRLRYFKYCIWRREHQGDLTITDPFGLPTLNPVMPGGRMVFGSAGWAFRNPPFWQGSPKKVRICIVDSLGRKSWSKKILLRWMNDPDRFL